MGRDVTGLRVDQKPSTLNAKSRALFHVIQKDKAETNDVEPEDHSIEDRLNHKSSTVAAKSNALLNANQKENIENRYVEREEDPATAIEERLVNERNDEQDALHAKSTNNELEEKTLSTDVQKSIEKTLSSPRKQSSDGTTENSLEPLTAGSEAGKQTSRADHEKSQPNSPTTSSKQQQHFHGKRACDAEDNWSLGSSSSTSLRTNKSKPTVPVAPRFIIEDRLERRKEFYVKLEEKHKALEKERLEREARIKDEEATAIKQLRKSMVYKANPVPSFYREGPPPKAEFKKLPATRAKSPNLTRRKSCGDAAQHSPEENCPCGTATRHDVVICKEGKVTSATPKMKDRVGACKSNEDGKLKNQVQESKRTSEVDIVRNEE